MHRTVEPSVLYFGTPFVLISGADPVSLHKHAMGYRHERSKFGIAGFTPVTAGTTNHIDPDKWRPLLMSFCRFYGLSSKGTYSSVVPLDWTDAER